MQSSFGAGKRYTFRPEEEESGSVKVGISGILSLETTKEQFKEFLLKTHTINLT